MHTHPDQEAFGIFGLILNLNSMTSEIVMLSFCCFLSALYWQLNDASCDFFFDNLVSFDWLHDMKTHLQLNKRGKSQR